MVKNFVEDVSTLVEIHEELTAMTEKTNTAILHEKSSALMHPEVLGNAYLIIIF